MYRSSLVLAALLFAATVSVAEPIKRTLPSCITEEDLDEMTGYMIKKDNAGISQLVVAGKCTVIPVGESVSVIKPGFMIAQIRYKGIKLYTPSEAIR